MSARIIAFPGATPCEPQAQQPKTLEDLFNTRPPEEAKKWRQLMRLIADWPEEEQKEFLNWAFRRVMEVRNGAR